MTKNIPESNELGLDSDAERVDRLAREVLGENYFHFHIKKIVVDEDMERSEVKLTAALARSENGSDTPIEGVGVGLVDAFFNAVLAVYAGEYPSLKTITVSDFSVRTGFDSAKGRKSDALAVASLRMKNSEGVEFCFERGSPSVTRSSVRVALDALTFFINSERAYVQLHLALKDAHERRRSDLVQRYQTQMGTLVHATSYSDVIERLKNDA